MDEKTNSIGKIKSFIIIRQHKSGLVAPSETVLNIDQNGHCTYITNGATRDIRYGISNWISDYVNEGTDSVVSRSEIINLLKDPFFGFGIDSNFVSIM